MSGKFKCDTWNARPWILCGCTVYWIRVEVVAGAHPTDFMEQQQHGFSDSTPRAGSENLLGA